MRRRKVYFLAVLVVDCSPHPVGSCYARTGKRGDGDAPNITNRVRTWTFRLDI